MDVSTAWVVLGLQPPATLAQVKRRYIALARDAHPDRVAHLGDVAVERSRRRMTSINLAYEAVSKALAPDVEASLTDALEWIDDDLIDELEPDLDLSDEVTEEITQEDEVPLQPLYDDDLVLPDPSV